VSDQNFTIQDLIRLETDMLDNTNVKLVRHKDNRPEYKYVFDDLSKIYEYQKEQGKDEFMGADYIVSFLGQENSRAKLLGVFKVNGHEIRNGQYYYDLELTSIAKNLIDRVVIDWGKTGLAWVQWYSNLKEVVKLDQFGSIGEFRGLLDFVLDFQSLKRLINHPEANSEWRYRLSNKGIYMILDKKTGMQYIGSASGKDGIWGRWQNYAHDGYGGNTYLIDLHKDDPDYHLNFQYTVLQTLPSNISKPEVDAIESLYKIKFGSRDHGYNKN
jgi:hypothetical protein